MSPHEPYIPPTMPSNDKIEKAASPVPPKLTSADNIEVALVKEQEHEAFDSASMHVNTLIIEHIKSKNLSNAETAIYLEAAIRKRNELRLILMDGVLNVRDEESIKTLHQDRLNIQADLTDLQDKYSRDIEALQKDNLGLQTTLETSQNQLNEGNKRIDELERNKVKATSTVAKVQARIKAFEEIERRQKEGAEASATKLGNAEQMVERQKRVINRQSEKLTACELQERHLSATLAANDTQVSELQSQLDAAEKAKSAYRTRAEVAEEMKKIIFQQVLPLTKGFDGLVETLSAEPGEVAVGSDKVENVSPSQKRGANAKAQVAPIAKRSKTNRWDCLCDLGGLEANIHVESKQRRS